METAIRYRLPFSEAASQVFEIVSKGLCGDASLLSQLDDFEESVYIKNGEGTLTIVNEAYRQTFVVEGSPLGRKGKSFLDPTIVTVSLHSDALIVGGAEFADFEHTCVIADGRYCRIRSFKRDLRRLRQPGHVILGISRPEAVLEEANGDPAESLTHAYEKFRSLEDRDQEICRLTALGHSSTDIGEALSMTSRNVELRRKKAFETLDVEKPVDLTRLLVHLQERGYLDLAL